MFRCRVRLWLAVRLCRVRRLPVPRLFVAPPPPTRPVQVRVDVVVRPEAPTVCVPQRFCCENPPIFEPIFCHAAWMLRSIVLAPLGVGERFLGHGIPRQPCPPPIPVACPPRFPPPAYLNNCAPLPTQGMAPCPPLDAVCTDGPLSQGPTAVRAFPRPGMSQRGPFSQVTGTLLRARQ